jgi:hypothetical protein
VSEGRAIRYKPREAHGFSLLSLAGQNFLVSGQHLTDLVKVNETETVFATLER